MEILMKNIKYHRDKNEAVPINEAQALLLICDMVSAALAQNGFTAETEIK
jgi:hypothetical protein